jgi:hypothetical protein
MRNAMISTIDARRLSRRQFLTGTACVGALFVSGCLSGGEDDTVALVLHNESSNTQQLRVRLFRPSGESIDTFSYALQPGDSVDGMHTVTGDIGEIAASAHAQNTFVELPDARTQYTPDIECVRGRPDVVITLRDEGIHFSSAC